ncbi:MAG: PAC2 family protein [Actinobacteria bacterium]|nr:PAC2 family protein [Actinomycetota bacterium]
MDSVTWDHRPSGLRAPAMVCAFDGWNDAGDAASLAVAALISSFGGNDFARIELESFLDLRETRPIIRVVDGEVLDLTWPATTLTAVFAPRAPRDLIVVSGPEPALSWRAYCDVLVDLAESLECSMVVTLGAFLADLPHTRPVPIAGTASDPALSERLGLVPSNYEGPSGVTSALHHAFAKAGVPAVGLWAAVPHYIAAMPNPKAALALVRRLESLTGVIVDAEELEGDAVEHDRQVEQAVQHDSDLRGFVEQLEEAAAEDEPDDSEDIPSGDSIERDVQRFLRQRDVSDDKD